jgi:hypothetical protein
MSLKYRDLNSNKVIKLKAYAGELNLLSRELNFASKELQLGKYTSVMTTIATTIESLRVLAEEIANLMKKQ